MQALILMQCSLKKCGWALCVLLLCAAHSSGAGVYLALVVDPSTTAGAGIASVPRTNSTGTFNVTSTMFGANSFHLFALDDTAGSFGISYFKVQLDGTVSNLRNRSTMGIWDLQSEEGESLSSASSGFSDQFLRSGNDVNPIRAGQGPASPMTIGGFGRTAGSLNDTPNVPAPNVSAGETFAWVNVVSGQWGEYATDPAATPGGKKWFFLGEGNYAGAAPTFNPAGTEVFYYSSANLQSQAKALLVGIDIVIDPGPPIIDDLVIDNVNSSDPGSIEETVTYSDGIGGMDWGFEFASFTPSHGAAIATGIAAAANAQFNGSNQQFSWNTIGAPRGTYVWNVSADAGGWGSDTGTITVHVTAVPEPASFGLVGLVGIGRRR